MNKETYIDGNTITTLTPINTVMWMAHERRECVRKLVTYITGEHDTIPLMKVEIELTRSRVLLYAEGESTPWATLEFRHWLNDYPGAWCKVGDTTMAYTWVSNQWVNLH